MSTGLPSTRTQQHRRCPRDCPATWLRAALAGAYNGAAFNQKASGSSIGSMKTLVQVIVPFDVPLEEISNWVDRQLARHQDDENAPDLRGRYDYLVGNLFDEPLSDPVTIGRLPARDKRILDGRICEVSRLPKDRLPGALVTPDGQWHDLRDFGWRFAAEGTVENEQAIARWSTRYHELIAENPWCWIVETYAHS